LGQPSFCLPTFEASIRIPSCGLHSAISTTLLAYIVIFGGIRWIYLQVSRSSQYSRIHDNEEWQFDNGHLRSLRTLANAIQISVGFLVLSNILNIMFIFAVGERVDAEIPPYLTLSAIFYSIAWVFNYYFILYEKNNQQKWSHYTQGFWYLAFILVNIELYNGLMYFIEPHEDDPSDWTQSLALVSLCFIRYIINFILVICAVMLVIKRKRSYEVQGYRSISTNEDVGVDDDQTVNESDPIDTPDVGTPHIRKPISMADDPKYAPPQNIGDFLSRSKKLIPFLWPAHDIKLQVLIVICILLLVVGRIVNALLPYQNKVLVDRLTAGETIWKDILIFVGLRFLQGDVGILNTIQNLLWIPVGQFTTREISVKMFEHLLSLSLRFHHNRKTGEILRVQDRGVSSIVSILSSILFNIIPTLVDITIAIIYFTLAFDLFFGMIVFITMSLYIISTIIMTEWRTKYRRLTNQLDNAMEAKAVDSLLNYETVKLYAAEPFEVEQYTRAILDYQMADLKSNMTLYILNTAQNVTIQFGLLAGLLLCAVRISKNEMSIGDFVMYLSYILQLYAPLNWFGNYYRVIQKNFVDMEKMLDLLQEPPEIKDLPQAAPLVVKKGEVVFDNVSFSYDSKVPTLKNISFSIPSGYTVALVGPSGGGKSTILRLLFRFYDVQSGRILVDGQDIRHVRQRDLRSCIGIVPQDTVLFNDTIKYNIRYSKIGATDKQVEEAASAAQIHDKILGFSEGYETKVGERGLRLSGGEKQRVNPQIVLLDEATSALDTRTERHIQKSLRRMTANRTTLIIAHRLSTIVHADRILVVQDGEIVERGTHLELLQQEGVYYKLWNKQLKHHEKIKREAENQQCIANATDIATTAINLPEISIVDNFTGEEECGKSNANFSTINRESGNMSPRNEMASFAEEEGIDGDDERLTTAHESSDEEGKEDNEIDDA
ncbi:19709_t:CDS:10, partial [Gigaspora rosea]